MQGYWPREKMSEDCLALNVWTPAVTSDAKLPVLVWVHGGGFLGGAGSNLENQGQFLASHGIIVVTINYRLGILGFLAHPALSNEVATKTSGNYGLQDQIAALRWVRDNIGAFGGDPSNVTLAGQSAGGASVSALMTAPAARGLFHRVIAQSGYPYSYMKLRTADTTLSFERLGVEVAENLKCTDPTQTLNCMRSLDAGAVIDFQESARIRLPTQPNVDGNVLLASPYDVFTYGKETRVPTIIGLMKDEQAMDPSLKKLDSIEKYKNFLSKCFPDDFSKIFNLYPAQTKDEVFWQAEHLETDLYASRQARRMARVLARDRVPTFLYHFTRVPPDAEQNGYGAYHLLDVLYLFKTTLTKNGYDPYDFALSDLIEKLWAQFANTGDPNTSGTYWPQFNNDNGYIEFGNQVAPKYHLDDERLDALDSVKLGDCTIQ